MGSSLSDATKSSDLINSTYFHQTLRKIPPPMSYNWRSLELLEVFKNVYLYYFLFLFYKFFYSPFRREKIKSACLPLPRPLIPTVWYISLYSSKYFSIHKLIYNHLCFSANNIIILYCYTRFSLLIINISLCQCIKFNCILYKAVTVI